MADDFHNTGAGLRHVLQATEIRRRSISRTYASLCSTRSTPVNELHLLSLYCLSREVYSLIVCCVRGQYNMRLRKSSLRNEAPNA